MGILRGMKEAQIGALDREITLHSLTYTTGAAGEQIPNTETTATVWAKVVWKYGDEEMEAGRNEMNTRVEFVIRYYTGINNKFWIEYESEKFDIVNIQEMGRKRFHRVLTERRV